MPPGVSLLGLLLPLPRVAALVCLPAVVPPRVPQAWLVPASRSVLGARVLAFTWPPVLFRGVVTACSVAVPRCPDALRKKSQRQQEAESHGCCKSERDLEAYFEV